MNERIASEQTPPRAPRRQAGVMLMEVLIAVLVFSVGVLGIVQLQALAVKQSTDAQFRATASLLANDLISRMWTSDRKLASLQNNFGGAGKPGYDAWFNSVKASGLPKADEPNNQPKVTIVDSPLLPGAAQAQIEMFWRLPGDDKPEGRHSYLTIVVLK